MSVSRERENRSVSGPEARTLDLSFSFSPLGGQRTVDLRLARSLRAPSSSFPSHPFSSRSLSLLFLPLFRVSLFLLRGFYPLPSYGAALLPIAALFLVRFCVSARTYPVPLQLLLRPFIVHLWYVTDMRSVLYTVRVCPACNRVGGELNFIQ